MTTQPPTGKVTLEQVDQSLKNFLPTKESKFYKQLQEPFNLENWLIATDGVTSLGFRKDTVTADLTGIKFNEDENTDKQYGEIIQKVLKQFTSATRIKFNRPEAFKNLRDQVGKFIKENEVRKHELITRITYTDTTRSLFNRTGTLLIETGLRENLTDETGKQQVLTVTYVQGDDFELDKYKQKNVTSHYNTEFFLKVLKEFERETEATISLDGTYKPLIIESGRKAALAMPLILH